MLLYTLVSCNLFMLPLSLPSGQTVFRGKTSLIVSVPVQNSRNSAFAFILSSFRARCCLLYKFNLFCFVLGPLLWRTGPHWNSLFCVLAHSLHLYTSFTARGGTRSASLSCCELNKYTQWDLWVKFYLGQNEDHSSKDSLSDSSEELFQRACWGQGGGVVSVWFWWRRCMKSGTCFGRRLLLVTRSRHLC